MPITEIRKKTVFLLLTTTVLALILFLIPPDDALRRFIASYFKLAMSDDGKFVSIDGSMTSQFGITTAALFLNLAKIVKVVLGMAIVTIVVRYVNFIIFHVVLRNASQNEISSLLRTVLSIIISIVAFFIIFQSQYPTVELAPLFTGSTILGIVVGLALQDTLGNLFAGIALQADQPFQVGDVVNIQNGRWTGVVEQVSWRGVKMRTFQNKIVLISNAILGKEFIEVAPKENLNARLVFFNTIYSASPAKTIHLIREAVRQVENVSPKIRPVVRIRNLGDNGIDYEVKYWPEDYSKYNDTDALIRQRVWYAFQRENIHFAFPTRTLYIEKQPLEPAFTESADEIFDRLSDVALFAPLTDEQTRSLAAGTDAKIFASGEKIIRRGQDAGSMFVIHRGSVRVQINEDGHIKILRTLSEGEFFGEMGLFTGEPRTATVVAQEETEVLEIKHFSLKPILEQNPELVERFCEIIGERRARLAEADSVAEDESKTDKTGMFNLIRRFFGLK